MASAIAIILAAGSGQRLGGLDKALLPLAGRPTLAWCLMAFDASPHVDRLLVVTAEPRVDAYQALIATGFRKPGFGMAPNLGHRPEVDPAAPGRWLAGRTLTKLWQVIAGGSSRHASEAAALAHLRAEIEADAIDLLLIHDAARPAVTSKLIERVVNEARRRGSAVPALSVDPTDTIVEVDAANRLVRPMPSRQLWRAQTPQAISARVALTSYQAAARANFEGSDTASCVEWAGFEVCLTPGDPANRKLTVPEDVAPLEATLLASVETESRKVPR